MDSAGLMLCGDVRSEAQGKAVSSCYPDVCARYYQPLPSANPNVASSVARGSAPFGSVVALI